MASNSQKTPFIESLNSFTQDKVQTAVDQLGQSLPCSVVSVQGSIVTVKFEIQDPIYTNLPNVTVPLFGPEYIRYPIQVGDKGVVLSADAYLGGMSGLGGGVANLTQRGNLTALVFFPIGNKAWTTTDPNAVTVYGKNGVVLRDTTNASSVTVLPASVTLKGGSNGSTLTMNSSSISLSAGGHTLTINATGITLDGILFATHNHSGVMRGTGVTGPVAT